MIPQSPSCGALHSSLTKAYFLPSNTTPIGHTSMPKLHITCPVWNHWQGIYMRPQDSPSSCRGLRPSKHATLILGRASLITTCPSTTSNQVKPLKSTWYRHTRDFAQPKPNPPPPPTAQVGADKPDPLLPFVQTNEMYIW